MITDERKKFLEKQGYRIVGNHSAIKTCHYCSTAMKGNDVCYKNTFYNIASWRCIQATVTLDLCNLRCRWCWRDINYGTTNGTMFTDKPQDIVEGLISEHKNVLMGFYGNKNIIKERLQETMEPKHIALSLTGDACLYSKLPELVDEIHRNNMTSFVVTNGTITPMVKKLINHQPTQLYITLPAPNKETYLKMCNPISSNYGWENILESLYLLKSFKRTAIRLTLVKNMNMFNPEEYALHLADKEFNFLELKSAMPIGDAKYRMEYSEMPTHEEIKKFAEKICSINQWKIIDEKPESKVVLVMKEDREDRFLKFDIN
ncbi:4-demethylwyosine synthase TYW1 [Candidatus Woesearchaeota archaeon]|nr:4-demethylwyosine synthase TYW1 [Candidatus Woesearchaeota archaeon]